MSAHTILLEQNDLTGPRLKYYSAAADVGYWTALWESQSGRSYTREKKGHLPHQLRATFSRWVKPGPRVRVLEAGCGLGHFTVAASALGYRAEGLDWSNETVERLRQQFPSITWHHGDVRALPFDDQSFDAVYSPGVCEHFEEGPVQIIRETRRILRPSGTAVFSTPCLNSWVYRNADRLFPQQPPSGEFYQYAFTPQGMTRLLEREGFEVVQVKPYGAIVTLSRYTRWWWIPQYAAAPMSWTLDHFPFLKSLGSTCLWVAKRR